MTPYLREDELHLAFNFTLLFEGWEASGMREAIDRSRAALAEVGAPPTWVLENHDVTRLPTRYGGGAEGLRRARAAALLLLALPGPAFLYQGQELGLEEVELADHVRQDPIFRRSGGARKGRDGCRVPIPWEALPFGFGFTTGTPWLPVPDEWQAVAVTTQEADDGSMLSLYRSALARRRDLLLSDRFAWLDSPPGTLLFERGELLCGVNVDAPRLALPEGELVLASGPEVACDLPAATAAWVLRPHRSSA
jgi:alpha-glucosidase